MQPEVFSTRGASQPVEIPEMRDTAPEQTTLTPARPTARWFGMRWIAVFCLTLFVALSSLPDTSLAQSNGNNGNANGNQGNGNGNGNNGNGNGNGGSGNNGNGNEVLVISSVVNEYAEVEFTDPDGRVVDIEVGGSCAQSAAMCLFGDATMDFKLTGNARIRLRVTPDKTRRVGRRRLGVYTYESGGAVDPDEVFYDLGVQVADTPGGFWQEDPQSPDQTPLDVLRGSREDWRENTDLRFGDKWGRITVQPVVSNTGTDIFAAVGNYSASVNLSIQTR